MKWDIKSSAPGWLGRVWGHPTLLGEGLLLFLLLVGLRWVFGRVHTLPGYMGFNPGLIFVPLGGVALGPAGAWASLAASLAGDRLADLWGPLSPYRAAGFFFYALSAQQVWEGLPGGTRGRRHAADAAHTVRFLLAALPGAISASAWPALGAERLGLYPFAYFCTLQLIYMALFVPLLGGALYRIVARRWLKRTGGWRERMEPRSGEALVSSLRVQAMLTLGVGSGVAGLLVSALTYGILPLQPYLMGTRSGPRVTGAVAFFLILEAVVLLAPRRRG